MLDPIREKNVLDIVLTSQKEFVDDVKLYEPLGCTYHNQIHLIIFSFYFGKRRTDSKNTVQENVSQYKDMKTGVSKDRQECHTGE